MDALDLDFGGVIRSMLRQATINDPVVTTNYQGMARESHAIPAEQTHLIDEYALVGPDDYLVDFTRNKIAHEFSVANHRLFGIVSVGQVKHVVLVRVYDIRIQYSMRAKPIITFITRQDGHHGARRYYELHGQPCKHYEVVAAVAFCKLSRTNKLITHFGINGISQRWFNEINFNDNELMFSRFVIEQLAREKANRGNDVPHYPGYQCFTRLLTAAGWQLATYTALVTRYS